MGQGQSTNVQLLSEENDRIKYAVLSTQGKSLNMEDAHAAILDLDDHSSTSFFGVYDGHGGANVASYCANRFHTELAQDEDYQNNLSEALKHVFPRMDKQMHQCVELMALANPHHVSINSLHSLRTFQGDPYTEGTTASVALIRGHQVIVGNVGDSRCVLSRNGLAIDLSIDHTPHLDGEYLRIMKAGGHLIGDESVPPGAIGVVVSERNPYSIDGIVPVSRSIGDFRFKLNKDLLPTAQMVTCTPYIHTEDITHDTEFLLIASGAVWEMLPRGISSQIAVDAVRRELRHGTTDLHTICETLLDDCSDSKDNLTVILVQFKPPPPALTPADVPSSTTGPPPAPGTMPVPDSGATAGSSNADTDVEAKADTSGAPQSEIMEE